MFQVSIIRMTCPTCPVELQAYCDAAEMLLPFGDPSSKSHKQPIVFSNEVATEVRSFVRVMGNFNPRHRGTHGTNFTLPTIGLALETT